MRAEIETHAQRALREALILAEGGALPFCEAAAKALEAFPPCSASDFLDYLSDCAASGQPAQRNNPRFGQPSVVVARDRECFVELLLWRDDITSIHEHSFEGAFKALDGRRLHSTFTFSPSFRFDLDPRVERGKLELKNIELLSTGSIRMIKPGREFIHMLWTVDRPGLTVAIRQNGTKTSMSYLPPGLGFDEFSAERELAQFSLALEIVKQNDRQRWTELLSNVFSTCSLNTLTHLTMLLGLSPGDTQWAIISTALRKRSEDFLLSLLEAANTDYFLRQVAALRSVADEDTELLAAGAAYLSLLSENVVVAGGGIPALVRSHSHGHY